MTGVGLLLLVGGLLWWWGRRPLLPRDSAVYLSARWQRDHVYHAGKHKE